MELGQVGRGRDALETAAHLVVESVHDLCSALARGSAEELAALTCADTRVVQRVADDFKRARLWLPGQHLPVELERTAADVQNEAVRVVVATEAVDEADLVAQVGLGRGDDGQAAGRGQSDEANVLGVEVGLSAQRVETDADGVHLVKRQSFRQHAR